MMPSVGLADLARLFRALPVEDHAEAAATLGFRRTAVPDIVRPDRVVVEPQPRQEPTPTPAAAATGRPGFVRVVAAKEREPAAAPPRRSRSRGLTASDLASQPREALPPVPSLAPWSRLWSPLQAALHTVARSRDPDVAALVRAWARGECVSRMPRRERRTWAASVALWIDRSSRLTPFWADQEMLCAQLTKLCGTRAIALTVMDGVAQAARAADASGHGDLIGPARIDRAVPVLVLGDLGLYGTESDRRCWLRTAGRLRRERVRIAALVPCPVRRWDGEVARAWNAMPWERASPGDDRGSGEAGVAALLRLVAPTALAQPGLLRALRQLLPAAEADASTEVDVWRHADVQAADTSGLVLKPEASARWRERFAAEVPAELQAQVSRLIDHWHGRWRAELIHAETIAWLGHGLADPPGRPGEARAFIKQVKATLCGKDGAAEPVAVVKHYSRHMLAALPDQSYVNMPELTRVWGVAFQGVDDVRRPSTIAAHDLPVVTPRAPRWWALHQRGDALIVSPMPAGAWPAGRGPGSPVAMIAAADPRVWMRRGDELRPLPVALEDGAVIPLQPGERLVLDTDRGSEVTLDVWERAPWAVAAGRDRHGLWAAFEAEGVQQRLRWIPPGRFLMGSPETEAGRLEREGPQHWVTLTKGYWLGETPVTQALWRAVMKDNPSRFKTDDRPVEQVSWDDCQQFLERLNHSLDGFETRLPTEAEWERACRAGTTTATWVGDLTLRGQNDAPELDAIAWYGGNSGVNFDLDDGYDSTDWPEKQHANTRAGTHPVGQLAANPYGLHDMLGNVYEWCQDAAESWDELRRYTSDSVEDPVAPDQGSYRVTRGGAWRSYARLVRAAYRHAISRDSRNAALGFRLAGGQVPAGRPGGAEPRSGEGGRGAGRDTSRASKRHATTPRGKVSPPRSPRPGKTRTKKDA